MVTAETTWRPARQGETPGQMIPELGEAHARARLDALIAEHGLPQPKRHGYYPSFDTNGTRIEGRHMLDVVLKSADDVHRWAQVLGTRTPDDHRSVELDRDGSSWAVYWTVWTFVADWLPGVQLHISWGDSRIARADR